jgi:trigger factor
MKVSLESIGKLERRMQVLVPAQRVTQEIDARLKTLSRTARLNGFRPGKAPLNVIRRQFGVQVHREVIGELLQSSFSEAITQNRLAPAGSPRIEPQNVDEGEDLRYVATFEVYPEVALQPVEALEIERTTAEVVEGDVDAMIARLRKQSAKFAPVERAAQRGDKVTVDFEGSIDGVAFPGGKGENVPITLGEGRMLAELENGLVGVSAAERREIGLTFPADYRAVELAGKHAVFQVSVTRVEESVLPELDEEFCAAFGVTEGGIPKLREEVAANMRRELAQALRNRNRAAVLEKLYEANPLDVPNALIEAEVREMQLEALRRAGSKDASRAPPREPLLEPARRRVGMGLLLREIVKLAQLRLDPARASARLDEMVGPYGDPATLRRAYQQNADAMRQVESLTLEDQVVDWVLERAKVREVGSSFRELMNFEG